MNRKIFTLQRFNYIHRKSELIKTELRKYNIKN